MFPRVYASLIYSFILVSILLIDKSSSLSLAKSTSSQLVMQINSGGHGIGFKYLPIHQAKPSENFPRIIQIAGIYPDLTPEDLYAPPPSFPSKKGFIVSIN